jgi:hypothetical protein
MRFSIAASVFLAHCWSSRIPANLKSIFLVQVEEDSWDFGAVVVVVSFHPASDVSQFLDAVSDLFMGAVCLAYLFGAWASLM